MDLTSETILELAPRSVSLLRQQVYDSIVNALLAGKLEPGVRLRESQIARQMGISQAPVREAFRQLEEQGILVSYRNRGTFIISLDENDANELYTLRITLETLAVHLATTVLSEADIKKLDTLSHEIDRATLNAQNFLITQQDIEFHRLIWERSGNNRLFNILQHIQLQVALSMAYINKFYNATTGSNQSHVSHDSIVQSLRNRDTETAEEAMKQHLLAAKKELLKGISNKNV
jgi:DNA-binding GntR family transcriptional regulator